MLPKSTAVDPEVNKRNIGAESYMCWLLIMRSGRAGRMVHGVIHSWEQSLEKSWGVELKSSSGLLADPMEYIFKHNSFKNHTFPVLIKAPCRLPEALGMLIGSMVWRILKYSMDLKAKSPAGPLGEIIIDHHSNWLLIAGHPKWPSISKPYV